ncbi:hypothetical protein ACIBG8_01600 [Nonomuraea sp. NPDC050556]|uniref:hypothetical protein n=1 Tax=Nonomuraea sp. NPDC050556 TaxID=3364369 RepID=UPI0037962DA8
MTALTRSEARLLVPALMFIALLSGAVATPVLGRLGAGPHRRAAILATLAIVVVGSALTVLPLPFAWLLVGRAAQGVGLAVALVTAWRSMPAAPEGRSAHVSVAGALRLAGGLLLVLFLAGEGSLWTGHLAVAVALACAAVLLLTLITRYAQAPHSAGYGFGLTTFVAGLVLIPFSVLGFVAGKLTPRVRTRIDGPLLLAGSAAMPGVILAVTPRSETSSAMSFNYVVRSVGYSLGSAVGGLVLAYGTTTGRLSPDDGAYTTAALVGVAAMAVTAMTSLALASRRPRETNPVTAPAD